MELGLLFSRELKLIDARAILEKAVAFEEKQRQLKSPRFSAFRLARGLDALGAVKYWQGDSKGAKQLLTRALEPRRKQICAAVSVTLWL